MTLTDTTLYQILEQTKRKFSNLKKNTSNKFESKDELALWFARQFIQQEGKCCYCETHIEDLNRLISAGLLKTRGKRGTVLEIERCDSSTNEYSPENCKLVCYYCNNDKSNVYSEEDALFLGKARGELNKKKLAQLQLSER